ncbi:MAG: hypothetical protein IKU15_00285 [Clostridia bacterium]|nr:hypothetical protein [Clostridia bacterium]
MNTNLLLELIDTSYQNARNKGFFSNNQPDEAYVAAIHDELSEAFREWNKRDNWYTESVDKLTGVYVELTDAVIRLMSYCGYKGISLKKVEFETDRPYIKDDICDMILKSHQSLAQYYELLDKEARDEFEAKLIDNCIKKLLSAFVARIELFIYETSNGKYNLPDLILTKLAYNKLRSGVRHGGNKV